MAPHTRALAPSPCCPFPSPFQGASTQKTTRTVEALQLPSSGQQGQEPSRFSCGRRLLTLRPPPPPPPPPPACPSSNCTHPSSVQLVPKILPPPPPPPSSALLSRISNPSPLPSSTGVALTNRRWPRPYRDCRVISPLLLFGLLGSALIWKIVAFWSAGGGCATNLDVRSRRRGGWSVPHAPTPTSHPCSLPPPLSCKVRTSIFAR